METPRRAPIGIASLAPRPIRVTTVQTAQTVQTPCCTIA